MRLPPLCRQLFVFSSASLVLSSIVVSFPISSPGSDRLIVSRDVVSGAVTGIIGPALAVPDGLRLVSDVKGTSVAPVFERPDAFGASVNSSASTGRSFNTTDPATSTLRTPPTTELSTPPTEPSFPLNSEYRGSISESSRHPFLAEVDTTFPARSRREYDPAPYETRYRAVDDESGSFDVVKHWGNLSPYYSSPLYPELQKHKILSANCKIKQVHILHRHGARLPTDDVEEAAPYFGQFLANLTSSNGDAISFDDPLQFLRDWKYDLGFNVLTRAGTQQLFDSGVQSFYRYAALYNASSQAHKPVVRSASQSRVIDSASAFSLGFFGMNATALTNLEVLIEESRFNSTLSPDKSCINAAKMQPGEAQVNVWLSKYLDDTVERLQRHIRGFTLTPRLVFGMQSLCAYETFAVGFSKFCPLFTKAEWLGFSYAFDLYDSWNHFNSPIGPAHGIGWSQELISRLKNTPFDGPVTSQNTTLDSSTASFPIDQSLYFDFSHDATIVSVLSALNFTQFASKLDPERMDTNRKVMTSHIIPFAARLVFEALSCNEDGVEQSYVRTILNDALLPLGQDQGCSYRPSNDGLCLLTEFVDHVEKLSVPAAKYQEVCFGDISGMDMTL
ncbi:hypothetical protein CBS101457_004457 [Exobasidium rhododendri]|nr:hypothetical protein CBS101457_004457 [Exobasidium rhododendri]